MPKCPARSYSAGPLMLLLIVSMLTSCGESRSWSAGANRHCWNQLHQISREAEPIDQRMERAQRSNEVINVLREAAVTFTAMSQRMDELSVEQVNPQLAAYAAGQMMLLNCSVAWARTVADLGEQSQVLEAYAQIHRSFTYRGQPIHPALVAEFSNWLSDPARSITVAVDLAAACGSNEYHQPVQITGDWVRYEREPGAGSFGYRWLGALEDGTHVLRTAEHGGGSGIFENLMLVRVRIERGYDPQEGQYQRLLMTAVGQIPLGDRSGAEVKVSSQRILIRGARSRKGSKVIRVDELP